MPSRTIHVVVNGKISLDEAESVIDMINATSDAELKANSKILKGELYKKISQIQKDIMDAIVNLEVSIDYPEHDDEALGVDNLKNVLLSARAKLEELATTATQGAIVRSGINVAIVGKPNVGKSSLLNALLGEERAIVTSVKGTTRDILRETVSYKGLKLNFIDTAGIHKSEDEVEKIGIERAKESTAEADIVLVVLDASQKLDDEDKQILELCNNHKKIIILNKTDVNKNQTGFVGIEISAKELTNIQSIKDKILEMAINGKIDFSGLIITNQRHMEAINSAIEQIDKTLNECAKQTVDILDLLAKDIWRTLGKITGETENEDIISGIFAKFCLGK